MRGSIPCLIHNIVLHPVAGILWYFGKVRAGEIVHDLMITHPDIETMHSYDSCVVPLEAQDNVVDLAPRMERRSSLH